MAATFAFSETYGTSPGTTADTTYVHLLSSDVASGAVGNHASYPITIPTSGSAYSYERYVRGHWTGTFTSISSVLFWKSAGTVGTGVTLNAGDKGNQTYASPVVTASSIATSAIPTTSGTALELGYATAYSDYVVLQIVVATNGVAGANGAITYRCQWQET
jgi:hypothetical protein